MEVNKIGDFLYDIKLVEQKISKIFEEEIGFSLTRYKLLNYLNEVQSCSQGKVQEVLKIDQAAITRHVKILEEKGYVTKQRNVNNNREVIVELTDKAKNQLNSCSKNISCKKKFIKEDFSMEDMEQLEKLFTKFKKSLNI